MNPKTRSSMLLYRGWDCQPVETAAFRSFFFAVFFPCKLYIHGQEMYILQKKKSRPLTSLPGHREAPNILYPQKKGHHRLLNWQIHVTRVSSVGKWTTKFVFLLSFSGQQKTKFFDDVRLRKSTFPHYRGLKHHFPVAKSGFWGQISH